MPKEKNSYFIGKIATTPSTQTIQANLENFKQQSETRINQKKQNDDKHILN